MTFDWISGHGNIGYGAAHNLAIRRADSDFHLILNPDVLIDKATFVEACRFSTTIQKLVLLRHMSQMETENAIFMQTISLALGFISSRIYTRMDSAAV